jgi:hypothetical protein
MTTEAPVVSSITTDWNWIKAHAALLVLVASLTAGSVYGVTNIIANHDAANAKLADARLAVATAQTTAAQQQLAQEQTQLLALVQQLQAQNAKLSQSIVQRNAQTATQVKTDATLNAQEAAVRLSTQTQAQPGEVVAANDTVVLDLPMSRRVVGDLDLLVSAQNNLSDTQTELANETQLFNKSQEEVADQTKVISDLQAQSKEQTVAYNMELTAVKAQARRGKIKAFFIGFGTGFVAGVTAHLW